MEEFVGSKSKIYAIRVRDKESKKSKGFKKSVFKNEITFGDYKKCLDNKIKRCKSMNLITSYKHEIYTVEMNKIVSSADDDKREILKDAINTLPHGHYKLKI